MAFSAQVDFNPAFSEGAAAALAHTPAATQVSSGSFAERGTPGYTPDSSVVPGGGGGGEGSYSTSSASLPPPTTGTYAYNTFIPSVGTSYTDPVFGGIVHRLNDNGAIQNAEDIYAHNWVNCDGTLVFQWTYAGVRRAMRISDGTIAYTGIPVGLNSYDIQWDMVNPDAYYYYSGTTLMRHNLAANTNDAVKNFGVGNTLEAFGGSVNCCDKTGTYFVVKYGGTGHVVNIANGHV